MPRTDRPGLNLVVADRAGRIVDVPGERAVGRAGDRLAALELDSCIPLPPGSELFLLPGREPLGADARTGEIGALAGASAVAAFLAPAYTQLATAAYRPLEGAPRLPLFAYTAVGWHRGRFWVPAVRVDPDRRQDIAEFDRREITRRARALQKRHAYNRLWQHLLGCALCSGCPAANNLVMARWEAPLPTSPSCNARCLGCLSLQPAASCCPATQARISFTPTIAEILEVAVPHLEVAPRAVVSFGQGCEGEPLLQAPLLEEAVRAIRARTARGTVNLNTNASRPAALARVLTAGLDSVRVSLNSARPELYRAYVRPRGFDFDHVVASMREVKRRGRFLSINYFVFPGVTDDPAEWESFRRLLRDVHPDLVQWRNLNLDPAWYWEIARPLRGGEPLGVATILGRVRREFPGVRFGYYNPPLRGRRSYR